MLPSSLTISGLVTRLVGPLGEPIGFELCKKTSVSSDERAYNKERASEIGKCSYFCSNNRNFFLYLSGLSLHRGSGGTGKNTAFNLE